MERCTLCGGRLSQGRCTECGLDNTKNDRIYRLNVHNEKAAKLHLGECEDNLNRPRKKTFGKNAWSQAETHRNTAGKTAGKTDGKTTGKTGTDVFGAPITRNTTSAAKARARRHQTGTVKKKSFGLGKKLLLLFLVLVFLNVVENEGIWQQVSDWLEQISGGSSERMVGPEEDPADWDWEEEAGEKPVLVEWNTSDPGYFELELSPGYYTIGYEIPAGTYQFRCDTGTAWLLWRNEGEQWWNYISLYSEEEQENMRSMEGLEDFVSWELTEEMEFTDGMELYLESASDQVKLAGVGEGADSLKRHEIQHGLEELPLEEETLTAGEEFPEGVYDLVFTGTDDYSYGNVDIWEAGEDDPSWYRLLDAERPAFYRQEFTKGMKVKLENYEEDVQVSLQPSY